MAIKRYSCPRVFFCTTLVSKSYPSHIVGGQLGANIIDIAHKFGANQSFEEHHSDAEIGFLLSFSEYKKQQFEITRKSNPLKNKRSKMEKNCL